MAIPTRRKKKNRFNLAIEIFKTHGGILRTSEALASGIHPDTLYTLRDDGLIEELSRGVFRLESTPLLTNPDFVSLY